ncbi:MAG: enoyl-CoA hydratase/isomerase family protein [SAR202 cluster bacterium]|mgnify:FL=1|nr:enoyl-CoA hydratase/isomerase family protein [SAR202 cluster bacterium]
MPKKTIYEKRDGIAYLTVNNPEKANVMDSQVMEEMAEEYRDFWEDRDMKVMILTGMGDRHFSAGHHIQPPPPGQSYTDIRIQRNEGFFWPRAQTVNGREIAVFGGGTDFPRVWKPVIAAVNGWAAGAGLYMLLHTVDIRIACEEHARFYFALLSNRGGIGSGPSATHLTRQLNYAHAMKMLLTDEPIDAKEAERIGLIYETVPHDQLMARCEALAERIKQMPPVAVRMLKEFAVKSRELPEQAAWDMQYTFNHMVSQLSTDGDDADAAFLEKRPRNVKGNLRG